jgi:hypothetical protein
MVYSYLPAPSSESYAADLAPVTDATGLKLLIVDDVRLYREGLADGTVALSDPT